jgi:4-coumarate--CoA ligase
LDRIGSKPGEVVMILTPNHIFVPVAYLGIVGSKRIFSGANPAYTVSGVFTTLLISTSVANHVQK